jgi:hypothetical protein
MDKDQRESIAIDISPKTRFEFPDGTSLVVAVKPVEDGSLQYGVNLIYNSGMNSKSEINLWLPPHSIDVLVPVLQESANEARFIMGHEMLDYPSINSTKKQKRKKEPTKACSGSRAKSARSR